MRTILLVTAYCPDTRQRPSRGCTLHGEVIKHDRYTVLGLTFCGLDSNKADLYTSSDIVKSICKRCLRNKKFADEVQRFTDHFGVQS